MTLNKNKILYYILSSIIEEGFLETYNGSTNCEVGLRRPTLI